MSRQEMKARAKAQLGNNLFCNNWLYALLVLLIVGLLTSAISAISFGIVGIFVTGPLSYGISYCFLKQTRDGLQMNITDVFKGFTDCFVDSFLIVLLSSIFIALWSLLFVIPGIVKTYSYAMATYIKIDRPELSAIDCISESRRIMKGHKWELFVLDLSFIGWYFVGSLCLGVGILWVAPYHHATRSQFYESIKQVPEQFEQPELF